MFTIQDLASIDPVVYNAVIGEQKRQQTGMELIASENYQSPATLLAQSTVFANKYSEGFPGKRYYGGQEYTDIVEQVAIDRAKSLFSSDHANVQALGGAAANIAIFAGLLQPGDTVLGMDLSHGGHLTHGAPVTFLAKIFNFVRYKTTKAGLIDYDQLRALAHEHKPKIILAGFSAYPREIDYAKFSEIAKEVGAIAFADMSHIGGLIAGKALANPLDAGFNVLMTTSHKSLRGPRGAIICTKGIVSNPLKAPEHTIENIPTLIDRSIFPGVQGGPHMNTIAGIAIALGEAQQDSFAVYAQQVLRNAKTLAQGLLDRGYQLVTGGTDNHMIVIDLTNRGYTGTDAEKVLDAIGISTSKSTIPDDPNPPFRPSGLRLGMQAMTTRGITETSTKTIVDFIDRALCAQGDDAKIASIRQEVISFTSEYPVPSL